MKGDISRWFGPRVDSYVDFLTPTFLLKNRVVWTKLVINRTFFTRHGNSLILSDFVLNTPPNPFHFPECFSYIFCTTSKFPNLDYIRSKYRVLNPFHFPGFFSYIFYTTSKFPNLDYIRSKYGVLNPFNSWIFFVYFLHDMESSSS